jgi:hypothetical protein
MACMSKKAMDKEKQIQYPHLLYAPIDIVTCGIASVKNSITYILIIYTMIFEEYPAGNIIGDRNLIMILSRRL